MISISKPIIGQEEIQEVQSVLNSGMLVQGPKVAELEMKFSQASGAKNTLAVSNGTAALHAALYAIGVGPSDEVITTPFTFAATVNSILMVGAKPIYTDIDPKTFNLDPSLIEKKITKKTKAILVVDLFGQPADYKRIKAIANKHNLLIVEDAAQSINADYFGKKSGNIVDIACFSLYATKNVMSGEGGLITTNNKKFYEKAKLFRHHGMDENKRYQYYHLGYNYRLSDLHAAIALAQLNRMDTITKRRRELAKKYTVALENVPGIETPFVAPGINHVFHQYTIKVTGKFPLTRDKLQEKLQEKDIQSVVYYPKPMYYFEYLKGNINKRKLPIVEKIVNEVLSIPVHPSLTDKEVDYVIESIKSYGKKA